MTNKKPLFYALKIAAISDKFLAMLKRTGLAPKTGAASIIEFWKTSATNPVTSAAKGKTAPPGVAAIWKVAPTGLTM